MFLKVYFIFLIANITLGAFTTLLEEDAGPNSTFLENKNITSASYTPTPNVGSNSSDPGFLQNGTTAMVNGTEIPIITDIVTFFEQINLEYLFAFVNFFNLFFIMDVIDDFSTAIGIDFPDQMIDGLAVIFAFASIIWVIFVIHKVAPSAFT